MVLPDPVHGKPWSCCLPILPRASATWVLATGAVKQGGDVV